MLTGLINYNLNKAVNPWTKDNVNDKFKDWVNYNCTSTQWNQHININHPTNIAIIKEDQTKVNPIVSNDFFEQGLNGNLGSVYQYEYYDNTSQYEYYDNTSGNWKNGYSYFYGVSILTSTQFKDLLAPKNYASLKIGNLYDSSYYLFNSSFRGHTNLEFFQLYNKLLGLNVGFNVFDRREFITWYIKNNVKFKLVDKNSVNLKIFSTFPSYNPNFWRYVVITPGYAKKHHLKLGDHISFKNYQQDQDLVIGAFGTDSQNGYPTIYDVDVFITKR